MSKVFKTSHRLLRRFTAKPAVTVGQLIVMLAAVTLITITINNKNINFDRSNSLQAVKTVKPKVKFLNASTETTTTKTAKHKTTLAFEQYKPRYTAIAIHPSNYGDRHAVDVNGNVLTNRPIVVLHETTNSAVSAINTFRNANLSDRSQVSYHALIALDGTIVYLVASDKRAFGAGNSAFIGDEGVETVQTNPNLPSSVNNFAYHVSLETPVDGRGNSSRSHSGYTDNQYKSLAWLLTLTDVPDNRITTHENVDRSGARFDPRSFDFDKLLTILRSYRQPIVN